MKNKYKTPGEIIKAAKMLKDCEGNYIAENINLLFTTMLKEGYSIELATDSMKLLIGHLGMEAYKEEYEGLMKAWTERGE